MPSDPVKWLAEYLASRGLAPPQAETPTPEGESEHGT